MKKILFIICFFTIGLFPVKSQWKKDLPVTINYYLPKIVYDIEVHMVKTTFIPGPYEKYIHKLMKATTSDIDKSDRWEIEDINIRQRAVPDDKAHYTITAGGKYQPIYVNLTKEGILEGIGSENNKKDLEIDKLHKVSVFDNGGIGQNWQSLGGINNLKEVVDTNYSYQKIDNVMKKVWDPKFHYEPLSEEALVDDIISQIYFIRSQKAKVLSNELSVSDGKSLETIIKELNKQEDYYTSLFIGRKIKTKVVKTFVQSLEKVNQSSVVFIFSPTSGASKEGSGIVSYTLSFQTDKNYMVKKNNYEKNIPLVFYRIPLSGVVKLMRNGIEIMSFPSISPQLGTLGSLPLEIISSENVILELHPEYGSIKRLYRRK